MNSAKKRILLVEDDEEFAGLLVQLLGDAFDIRLCLAPVSMGVVIEEFRRQQSHAVILDLHMPHVSGQQILTELRILNSELPVFLLTSDQTLSSKLAGLKAAADDYLDKSMHPDEIIARIDRVLAKRTAFQLLAGLHFDPARLVASHAGADLALTRTEYALLYALAFAYPGSVARDALFAAAWPGRAADEKTLNTHMYNLRKKISSEASLDISSEYDSGYRLEKIMR